MTMPRTRAALRSRDREMRCFSSQTWATDAEPVFVPVDAGIEEPHELSYSTLKLERETPAVEFFLSAPVTAVAADVAPASGVSFVSPEIPRLFE